MDNILNLGKIYWAPGIAILTAIAVLVLTRRGVLKRIRTILFIMNNRGTKLVRETIENEDNKVKAVYKAWIYYMIFSCWTRPTVYLIRLWIRLIYSKYKRYVTVIHLKHWFLFKIPFKGEKLVYDSLCYMGLMRLVFDEFGSLENYRINVSLPKISGFKDWMLDIYRRVWFYRPSRVIAIENGVEVLDYVEYNCFLSFIKYGELITPEEEAYFAKRPPLKMLFQKITG